MLDFAEVFKWLVDDFYPEANRIMGKLELYYFLKQGSWPNMAEIVINILTRPCLSRRIPIIEFLSSKLEAWCRERKLSNHKINWQFTKKDARIKLKNLCPKL